MASTLAAATDYYASPQGGGDGSSPSSPLTIADFWPVAEPGDTLLLLDGKYTGGNSMITPPRGLKGTQVAPIGRNVTALLPSLGDAAKRRVVIDLVENRGRLDGVDAERLDPQVVTEVGGPSEFSNVRPLIICVDQVLAPEVGAQASEPEPPIVHLADSVAFPPPSERGGFLTRLIRGTT